MAKDLFITGTDTEVGKTYITCQMLRQYRAAGMNAIGMKPVASGMQEVDGRQVNDDIEQIVRASDEVMDRDLVNQYAFRPFIAPHLAAAEVGESISIAAIAAAYAKLATDSDRVIVEGAGGLMTPLNEADTFVDLVQRLGLDVVLVVAIRLGCINHALLTQQVMRSANISFVGWVANYPDSRQKRDLNIEESLQGRLNAPLLGVLPWSAVGDESGVLDLGQLD